MTILTQLLQIILLKRRPQDLDYDQGAALFYVVLVTGLTFVMTSFVGAYSRPLLLSVVQSAANVAVLFGFLALAGKQVRFVQVCTALFGVSALLQMLMLLLAQLPLLNNLILFVWGWSIYLGILIYRDGFDVSTFRAILLGIGIPMISVMITAAIIPEFMREAVTLWGLEGATGAGTGSE